MKCLNDQTKADIFISKIAFCIQGVKFSFVCVLTLQRHCFLHVRSTACLRFMACNLHPMQIGFAFSVNNLFTFWNSPNPSRFSKLSHLQNLNVKSKTLRTKTAGQVKVESSVMKHLCKKEGK